MTAEFPGGKQQEVHDITIHFTAVQCQVSTSQATRGQCVTGAVHLLKDAQFPTHIEATAGAIKRDPVSILSQLETCGFGVERLVIGEYAKYTELNHGEPYPGLYAMDAVRLGIAMTVFKTEEEAIAAAGAFAAELEAEKAVAVPPPSS